MSDIELLPLPEYFQRDLSHMTWEGLTQAAINYASACVEAHTEALQTKLAEYQVAEGVAFSKQRVAEARAEALRAEVVEAREGWHMANGTAELAMKHRDAAEARAERLAEALREAKELIEATRRKGGFPGGFDITHMPEMRRLFTALAHQPAAVNVDYRYGLAFILAHRDAIIARCGGPSEQFVVERTFDALATQHKEPTT